MQTYRVGGVGSVGAALDGIVWKPPVAGCPGWRGASELRIITTISPENTRKNPQVIHPMLERLRGASGWFFMA